MRSSDRVGMDRHACHNVLDIARGDCIDPDPMLRPFDGQGADKLVDPALARGIGSERRNTDAAGDGRCHGDGPTALPALDPPLRGTLGDQERALQVDRENPVPLVGSVLDGGLDDVDARIANDAVQTTEGVVRSIDEVPGMQGGADIARDGSHARGLARKFLIEPLAGLLGLTRIDAADQDTRALDQEIPCDGEVDAAACPGHDNAVATEIEKRLGHGSAFWLCRNNLFQSFSYCARVQLTEGSVFKGRHFDRSVILLCVRWYLAYNLSLRNLEEMMAERGISVDHATIHRWIIRYSPELLERFNQRKRAVTGKWHIDETYIKVRGQWRYLYRAIDSNGDTVEFWFSERRNLTAAKRFLRKALKRHGRPERIVIDGSQTNREAILSCDTADRLQDRSRRELKPIRIRQSAYLNNRIEQDHRAIKRRIRPMLGFKSLSSARVILGGIEMVHMMRKGQAKYACNPNLSLAEQFELLAA